MSSIAKRCTAAAVLALAMLLPQFSTLQTSPAGLRLIADFEGCQLSPTNAAPGYGHPASATPQAWCRARLSVNDKPPSIWWLMFPVPSGPSGTVCRWTCRRQCMTRWWPLPLTWALRQRVAPPWPDLSVGRSGAVPASSCRAGCM